MKFLALFSFLSFMLISCGGEEPAPPNTVDPNPPASDNGEVVDEPKVPVSKIVYWSADSTTFDVSGFEVAGNIVNGAQWVDTKGTNTVLLTMEDYVEEYDDDAEMMMAEQTLHAYHYTTRNDRTVLTWDITDFVKECEFDIILGFIDGSLEITDLDDNGIGESSFLYKLSCTSDVSPNTLKLMLHEMNQKYAIRGTTSIDLGDGLEELGGESVVDSVFSSAPETFLMYAEKKWEEFKKEPM